MMLLALSVIRTANCGYRPGIKLSERTKGHGFPRLRDHRGGGYLRLNHRHYAKV